MADYIDRDKLKERLENFANWCRDDRKEGVDFVLDCPLPDIPTEDVVPRAEVEELSIELEAMRGAANSYKMHYENAGQEVAREIFEEIYNACGDCTYFQLKMFIAELKKKYIGE